MVDLETARFLEAWLQARLRCPLLIVPFRISGRQRAAVRTDEVFQEDRGTHEDVWLHDEVTSAKPRMFARDFTAAAGATVRRLQRKGMDAITIAAGAASKALDASTAEAEDIRKAIAEVLSLLDADAKAVEVIGRRGGPGNSARRRRPWTSRPSRPPSCGTTRCPRGSWPGPICPTATRTSRGTRGGR